MDYIDLKWLQEIPKHWKVDRLKDCCERITGGGTPKSSISEYWEEGDIIWVTPTDFSRTKSKYISDSVKKITELGVQKSSANKLPKGTVIMSSRASIGDVKIADTELTTNQGFVSYIPSYKLSDNFLYYVISCHLGEYFLNIASGTTFMEISRKMASLEYIPLPPKKEQIAIANYLDKACERIDKIIKIKEKQIDFNKLNFESKIHELVTKGLGEKEFLNSSSQTIGEYPKDWKISKLKNHCRIYPSNVDKKSFDNEIPIKLCNYVDVYYNDFITNNLDFMEATAKASEIKKFQLKIGDVLVTKDSEDPMDIGVPALVEESFEKFVCGYHLSMIRCNGFSLIGEYLFWLLKNKSIASQLFREATGVTRWAIASRHFKNLEIPLPSIQEQKEISAKLKELSIKNKLIENNIKTQIQTLKDYRKSLIHECVTGKKQIVKAKETIKN